MICIILKWGGTRCLLEVILKKVEAILPKCPNEQFGIRKHFKYEYKCNGRILFEHEFDFGCDDIFRIAIECKAYTWTKSGNIPSAKISILNEAVLFLSLLPDDFSKILILKKSENVNSKSNVHKDESLATYYKNKYGSILQKFNIKLFEFDEVDEGFGFIQKLN